jgi:acylphosphatase
VAETIVHRNITVVGRVQGVFYRASTYDKAQLIGIKGFVKNKIDGSVYIEAEGSSDQVDTLIQWCKLGPAYAFVEAVNTEDGQLVGFKEFEIRH